MAQGDVVVFESFIEKSFEGTTFNLGGTPDTIKCAIVDNTIVPTAATSNPTWGVAGTDLSANEQSGGSMTAGGLAMGNVLVSNVGNVIHLDFDNPATWTKNVANPTTCYYGIVYSDSATNKECIGYVDLGGVFDATTGDLTITWGAPFMTADN